MVAEQWLIQAIQAGKSYEQLPKKVQASVPLSDWKLKYIASAKNSYH